MNLLECIPCRSLSLKLPSFLDIKMEKMGTLTPSPSESSTVVFSTVNFLAGQLAVEDLYSKTKSISGREPII